MPDPNLGRMGFFLTTSEAQTTLEFDLSQVAPSPRSLPMVQWLDVHSLDPLSL